jgi:hypothetical protein
MNFRAIRGLSETLEDRRLIVDRIMSSHILTSTVAIRRLVWFRCDDDLLASRACHVVEKRESRRVEPLSLSGSHARHPDVKQGGRPRQPKIRVVGRPLKPSGVRLDGSDAVRRVTALTASPPQSGKPSIRECQPLRPDYQAVEMSPSPERQPAGMLRRPGR